MATSRDPVSHPAPLPHPPDTAPVVRLARAEDGPVLAAIYAPYVRDTTVSLELDPPSAREMAARVERTLPRWPWLVAEVDDTPVGYAYGGAHRARPGYRWTVEVSAYVFPDAHGHGIGGRLYTALLALLAHQGHHLALAGIGLPNPASVGFHESLGFHHVGTFREIGHKFGGWQDVGWWQRSLVPPDVADATPEDPAIADPRSGTRGDLAPPAEPRALHTLPAGVVATVLDPDEAI